MWNMTRSQSFNIGWNHMRQNVSILVYLVSGCDIAICCTNICSLKRTIYRTLLWKLKGHFSQMYISYVYNQSDGFLCFTVKDRSSVSLALSAPLILAHAVLGTFANILVIVDTPKRVWKSSNPAKLNICWKHITRYWGKSVGFPCLWFRELCHCLHCLSWLA